MNIYKYYPVSFCNVMAVFVFIVDTTCSAIAYTTKSYRVDLKYV